MSEGRALTHEIIGIKEKPMKINIYIRATIGNSDVRDPYDDFSP